MGTLIFEIEEPRVGASQNTRMQALPILTTGQSTITSTSKLNLEPLLPSLGASTRTAARVKRTTKPV